MLANMTSLEVAEWKAYFKIKKAMDDQKKSIAQMAAELEQRR